MTELERFIPTCVGFMFYVDEVLPGDTVHPHVRGVYLRKMRRRPCTVRFIPTCVGFIRFWPCRLRYQPVHPHVRGVYAFHSAFPWCSHGSSPRAWGL